MRRRNEPMASDDFTNKNIFELMEAPIEKLKELSIEEFAEEINGKRVHIHPFTENIRQWSKR